MTTLKALTQLLAGRGSRISRGFDLLSVAEEALRSAWPSREAEPPGAFMLLSPPALLQDLPPDIFRSHAHELLERVKHGRDTRLATDAEVLAAMMRTALRAPLTNAGQLGAERLFVRVLPHRQVLTGTGAVEAYTGQLEEELTVLRHKLRTDARRL
jgi:hypothetical protein